MMEQINTSFYLRDDQAALQKHFSFNTLTMEWQHSALYNNASPPKSPTGAPVVFHPKLRDMLIYADISMDF